MQHHAAVYFGMLVNQALLLLALQPHAFIHNKSLQISTIDINFSYNKQQAGHEKPI